MKWLNKKNEIRLKTIVGGGESLSNERVIESLIQPIRSNGGFHQTLR